MSVNKKVTVPTGKFGLPVDALALMARCGSANLEANLEVNVEVNVEAGEMRMISSGLIIDSHILFVDRFETVREAAVVGAFGYSAEASDETVL